MEVAAGSFSNDPQSSKNKPVSFRRSSTLKSNAFNRYPGTLARPIHTERLTEIYKKTKESHNKYNFSDSSQGWILEDAQHCRVVHQALLVGSPFTLEKTRELVSAGDLF